MTHEGTGAAPALWAGLTRLSALDSGQSEASTEKARSHVLRVCRRPCRLEHATPKEIAAEPRPALF